MHEVAWVINIFPVDVEHIVIANNANLMGCISANSKANVWSDPLIRSSFVANSRDKLLFWSCCLRSGLLMMIVAFTLSKTPPPLLLPPLSFLKIVFKSAARSSLSKQPSWSHVSPTATTSKLFPWTSPWNFCKLFRSTHFNFAFNEEELFLEFKITEPGFNCTLQLRTSCIWWKQLTGLG